MRNLLGQVRPDLSFLVLLVLSCLPPVAVAHEIDISINADALRFGYATALGESGRFEGGVLHDSDEGEAYTAGFLVTGNPAVGNEKISMGIGARLAYLNGDGSERDGYALGLGGSVRWALPRYERFALSAEGYWAPEVLSGGDAEEYLDGTVRFGYSITRQAEVYLGARYVRADYEDRPSSLFDTGMNIGFNLRF
jgi:hypothetical protein